MKNVISFNKTKIIFLGGLLYFLFSCFEDPLQDFELQIAPVPMKTSVLVEFLDAGTGRHIGFREEQLIDFSVAGQDNGLVIDISQAPTTSFEVKRGLINFALTNEAAVPTESSPFELLLIARSQGYLTTSLPITLVDSGVTTISIYMVNLNNPPKGVNVVKVQSGKTDDAGVVTDSVNVSTGKDAITGGRTSLVIPPGVKITDKDGNALTGDITATVVFFNHQSEESLRAFPGGFSVNLTNSNGDSEESFFTTAGFVSYEIEDNQGRKGTQFDSSITSILEAPKSMYNPITKTTLAEGDSIPMWHYEPETGIWKYESSSSASADSSSENFIFSYGINHLSSFNFDWDRNSGASFYIKFRYQDTVLANYRNALYNSGLPNFKVNLKRNDNNTFFKSGISTSTRKPKVYIDAPPCNIPTTIEVWDDCPKVKWGEKVVDNMCAVGGTLIVDIDPSTSIGTGEKVNFQLTAEANCPSGKTLLKPTVPVLMSEDPDDTTSCPWNYIGMMNSGEMTIPNLLVGKKYGFGTMIFTFLYDIEVTISADGHNHALTFPESLCR